MLQFKAKSVSPLNVSRTVVRFAAIVLATMLANKEKRGMSWDSIAALIIKFGIEQAYKIWAIAKEGDPDDAAWDKLKALSLKSYDDYLREARERAGQADPPSVPPA